jgi:hypothetical protein
LGRVRNLRTRKRTPEIGAAMAENVQSLLLRVDATTEMLRRELAKAAAETDQWADKTQKSADRAGAAIDKASNHYTALSKSIGLVKGAAIGFAASFGAAQISQAAKAGLDYASSLGETAQQLGVSTKALQEYTYAATQVGVDQATLEAGLAKLTRTLGEAQAGGKKQVAAFAALGITYAELQRLSPDEAFRAVAKGLGEIADPAKRAAIEVDLFGKSGQKLDTLLAGGIGQIDALARAANELGVVLSDEQIQKADDTADKLAALQTVLSANIASVVADNAGGILTLANAIATLAGAAGRGIGNVRDYFVGLGDLVRNGSPLEIANGLLFSDEAVIARGQRVGAMRDILGGNLRANGLPGFDRPARAPSGGGSGGGGGSKNNPAARVLTASENRMGFGEKLGDVASLAPSVGSDPALVNLDAMAVKLNTIKSLAQTIPPINPIDTTAVELAGKFSDNLSRGLGQAIVYGQSLGDALVSSIKAAAAELISSQLLKLLNGGGDGGFIGGIIKGAAAIFGGRAAGGPVDAGTPYIVGEQRPEIFVPSTRGRIVPRVDGMGGGSVINVDARGATDPAIVEAAARRGAQQGIATAAQAFGKSQRTPIPRGRV